jgi:FMN reductase
MSEITVLAIGGSTRPNSSSERALHIAAAGAADAGAAVTTITGRDLILPIYDTEVDERDPRAIALIDAIRSAHGLIISSPGYHGGMSGMMKNALDYIEDLKDEDPVYLDGRAVGLIAVAHGWQATVSTLTQLRQVTHALRGWPTPLGGTVNSSTTRLTDDASDAEAAARDQLRAIGAQVVAFARMQRLPRTAASGA